MENSLLQMWKDANSPLEYLVTLWITSLAGLTLVGFVGLFYGIITGQTDFSNATFGIFDTLGN
jgi:predicted benzoate:H+ symporter BenE